MEKQNLKGIGDLLKPELISFHENGILVRDLVLVDSEEPPFDVPDVVLKELVISRDELQVLNAEDFLRKLIDEFMPKSKRHSLNDRIRSW